MGDSHWSGPVFIPCIYYSHGRDVGLFVNIKVCLNLLVVIVSVKVVDAMYCNAFIVRRAS